jgi:hypothetical protein
MGHLPAHQTAIEEVPRPRTADQSTPQGENPPMSGTDALLLSPNRRRIATCDFLTEDGNTLYENLARRCGWTPYDGPAVTDKRGWIIEGSDPAIVPSALKHHD